MGLTKRERQAIAALKRLGGKTVPVKQASKDLPNVVIGGRSFNKITKMATGNVGISAKEIIVARKKLIRAKAN